jgi:type IV pilus assembly protein PilE
LEIGLPSGAAVSRMTGIEEGVSFSFPKEPIWCLANSVCRTYSTVDALAIQRAVSNPYTPITNHSSEEMAMMTHRQRGFTLIELMMVVAIVAILAMVALPGYQQYVIRANRAAAQSEMYDIANREQQYFLANRVYADKATLNFPLSDKVSSKYTYDITVGAGVPPSFTITFTPYGTQLPDGNLVVGSDGTKTRAGDPAKW